MNLSKKLFLVGALLCLALAGHSQSLPERVAQKDLLDDACGKNVALPFSIPNLNLKEDFKSFGRWSCNYALGLSLPQKIAEELKALIDGAVAPKSMKNLQCDFLNPFDLKTLFDEKEQKDLNKN